jgi:uncharacterized protein (DUF58 family)
MAQNTPGKLSGLTRRIGRAFLTALRDVGRSHRSFLVPAEGWIFVVVTLAIGLAALNTSTQLLFLVFAMMCAFWTLSAVMATISLRGVSLHRTAPRVATAGNAVTIRIKASNRKRRAASFSIRIIDSLDRNLAIGAVFFPRIPPCEERSESYNAVFPRRGIYRFSRLTVATRFPFGLIERHWASDSPHELVVLPAIVDVGRAMRPFRSKLGEIETHQRGRGTGLYGMREYVSGESSRDIHWKVSARRGQLMLKEYEEEERRRASVVLDNRATSAWTAIDQARFEMGIVLASSVLAYLQREGHEMELVTASGRVGFDTGIEHLGRCRRALATLKRAPEGAEAPKGSSSEADCVRLLIDCGIGKIAPMGDDVVVRVVDLETNLALASGFVVDAP